MRVACVVICTQATWLQSHCTASSQYYHTLTGWSLLPTVQGSSAPVCSVTLEAQEKWATLWSRLIVPKENGQLR